MVPVNFQIVCISVFLPRRQLSSGMIPVVSFCIGLVGPKPYQCSSEPYQCNFEPYQCFYQTFSKIPKHFHHKIYLMFRGA